MTWLLIVLFLCMVLGPALMLLPSKRDKERMAFRRRAMAAGVRVQLTRIDDPAPRREDYLTLTGKRLPEMRSCIAYRLRRSRPTGRQRRQPPVWAVVHRPAETDADHGLPVGWFWENTEAADLPEEIRAVLAVGLADLGEDVLRLDERGHEVSAYWTERAEASYLAIERLLPQLAATPLPMAAEEVGMPGDAPGD